MDAGQMYNEFEIAYEAIASGDAAGYEPYEVSILLTQAQDQIIKQMIGTGIEFDDSKSLVLGPFIRTVEYTSFNSSAMYPNTFTLGVDSSEYWGIVNERLKESVDGDTVDVRPIDHAFFAANKDNPYKKPDPTRYHWRLIEKGSEYASWLIYGPTVIHTYYINYLDKPTPIIVPGVALNTTIDGVLVQDTIATGGLDCNYNISIHRNIVNKAAELGKAFIGDPQGVQLLSTN